jgi:heme-degrading monooxygenase HmoA
MTKAYTLATYHVTPGKEEEFIKAWHDLAKTFSALPASPYWGTLIRSITDRSLFHSFGPWESAEDVAAMRSQPVTAAAFRAIAEVCDEVTPGDYEIVTHVKVRDEPTD